MCAPSPFGTGAERMRGSRAPGADVRTRAAARSQESRACPQQTPPAAQPSSSCTSCSAASSNRSTSIEFANLDAARHRRHLSQLRGSLQSLEGGRAAHRRQRAHALLHRPHAPPARPRRRHAQATRRDALARQLRTGAARARVASPHANLIGRRQTPTLREHAGVKRHPARGALQKHADSRAIRRSARSPLDARRAGHAAPLPHRLGVAALARRSRWRCCSPRVSRPRPAATRSSSSTPSTRC